MRAEQVGRGRPHLVVCHFAFLNPSGAKLVCFYYGKFLGFVMMLFIMLLSALVLCASCSLPDVYQDCQVQTKCLIVERLLPAR